MNQAIDFYSKNVYGEWKMYIKDDEMAAKIEAITKQKTLTEWAKVALENLGFTFTEVIAPR
jgi:hypothetical protein